MAIVGLLFVVLLLTEWRPREVERRVYTYNSAAPQLPDTLRLVSWNIGYAGLGAEMDFFYDGGSQTRTTEERAAENLEAIIAQLRQLDDVDFVLLQEVDIASKRSYYVDQYKAIAAALDYTYSEFALNYSSPYVPIPLSDPMGGVESGLVVLSRYPIVESIRRQYPSNVGLPNRFFDLKRSMLSVAIRSSENDIVWINNTHNSAFDDGAERRREIQFIDNVICENPRSLTAGDWNSSPPNYAPSQEALENKFFVPLQLAAQDLPSVQSVIFDTNAPTMRYLDYPYSSIKSATSVVDFGVSGGKCLILESRTLDLGFANSDHNPILITFVLKN